MVDPSTMTWYLRGDASAGPTTVPPFSYGMAGWRPVVGDWDGNGTTVGVVDPVSSTWYLRNENSAGGPDAGQFVYGYGSWLPVAFENQVPGISVTQDPTKPPSLTQTVTPQLTTQTVTPPKQTTTPPKQTTTPPKQTTTPPGQDTTSSGQDTPVLDVAIDTPDQWESGVLQMAVFQGYLAMGELTITNTGPADSVLQYQFAGVAFGYDPSGQDSAPRWVYRIVADQPSGELAGGESQTIRIAFDTGGWVIARPGLGPTWRGVIEVSDPSGVAGSTRVGVHIVSQDNAALDAQAWGDLLAREREFYAGAWHAGISY